LPHPCRQPSTLMQSQSSCRTFGQSAAAVLKTAPAVAKSCPPVLHANRLAFQPEPASLCAADGDSRPPPPAPSPMDFQAVAAAQQTCSEVVAMSNSPSLQIVSATSPQGRSARFCRQLFDRRSYAACTRYTIQG
jgi:hypothetical protein